MNSLINAAVAHLNKGAGVKPKMIVEVAPIDDTQFMLMEALDPKHIEKIKNMPDTNYHEKRLHDEVGGKGHDTMTIPY